MGRTGLGRLAVALLAAWITAPGAAASSCAAVQTCPHRAAASTCHAASGADHHRASSQTPAAGDCCRLMAAEPSAAPVVTPASSDLPTPALAVVAASMTAAPTRATLTAVSRPLQRSGRALLSLHQTLLI